MSVANDLRYSLRLLARSPIFTVTSVTENPRAEFRRRIQGTFLVPLFLTGDGGPGERFMLDARGLRQP